MRVSRLFIDSSLVVGELLSLNDDNAHYVRAVLRLKKSAVLCLFNNSGYEYLATITEISRKQVLVEINSSEARNVESPLEVMMGLGISRGDRMDYAIQKAVELGVNAITPLLTSRSVVQLKPEKKQTKLEHWQKIAQHAAEQSGRTYAPMIHPPLELAEWVKHQQGLKVFLDPYADKTLKQLQPKQQKLVLLSGPEGGFTESERDIAKQAEFIPIKLGQRILRTETAALAAISAAQMLWGDFG